MTKDNLDDFVKDWDDDDEGSIKGLVLSKNNIVQIKQTTSIPTLHLNPLDELTQYSITGQSKKLRQKMLTDHFVLKDIAIMGQWTTIYGSPNSVKTLITNWLLREAILSEEIDGEMVYYINADDNYRGLVEKLELAEDWGMHMIAPYHNAFTVNQGPDLMAKMASDGSARGAIIILDTLKKFTDLMDKRTASQFGVAARGFVSAGGTLIALAHTNKHVGSDGKAIYSGTSDIVDDSDCCFVIDKISADEQDTLTTHTVEFNNIKARGDVSSKIGFTYKKVKKQQYIELLNSVKSLDENRLDIIKENVDIRSKLDEDANISRIIRELIETGTITKDKIIKEAKEYSGESTARVREVLEQRTGDMHLLGHRWSQRKEAHNRHVFEVLPTP